MVLIFSRTKNLGLATCTGSFILVIFSSMLRPPTVSQLCMMRASIVPSIFPHIEIQILSCDANGINPHNNQPTQYNQHNTTDTTTSYKLSWLFLPQPLSFRTTSSLYTKLHNTQSTIQWTTSKSYTMSLVTT